MNKHAIALALRTAAENLARARQLCQDLPPGVVDDDSAFTLFQDAPNVAHALYHVAGTLDPEGQADRWVGLVPPDEPDEVVDLAALAALGRQPRS